MAADIHAVLAEWRRGLDRNLSNAEIADQCGITVHALTSIVYRARKAGHHDVPRRRPGPLSGATSKTGVMLASWRRGCSIGMTSQEIADQCGVKLKTLRRAVCRARRAGHPDAVMHPNAVTPGTGWSRFLGSAGARARRRVM